MDLTPKTPPQGRMVDAGGNAYHLIELGEGPPVFFLHGGGPGCTAWSDFGVVVPLFARDNRCLLPDLLQYGKSDKPRIEGPMWDFHAASIVALLDALDIARADFVCNSWGGTIALCLAANYPDRVRSLTVTGSMPVFYGPLAPLPENGRRGRKARDVYFGGEGPTRQKMRDLIASLEWYDPALVPDALVEMRHAQSIDQTEMTLAAQSDLQRGDWQDLTAELGRVQCPTLFAWGREDAFLQPDYPLMLTRMVSRGQLHILDHASHHLQEERPEHYHRIVRGFLDQPEPPEQPQQREPKGAGR